MTSRIDSKRPLLTSLVGIAFILNAPALAAKEDGAITTPPAIYTELISCKNIVDAEQRLACFDAKVAALETAQSNNELVIADREQVREARRGLFGLSLPRIKLFGGGDKKSETVNQIESKIVSARQLRDGKWLMKLEDGALWRQTEVKSTMRSPKAGDTIVVKRGALGSFVAKVNGGRPVKVKRIVN
ncbi:hypothetical protein [Sphingorhabdus sp. EL138]|jgi:hypothetical protein|uniref:hypothetical protein n=1 Tax=Sphingorhabdus sp. EL138 TaxID=2073156 RepID=UPI000D694618|nr:hypothetical protein [Sphingorhabdus sp. EL138]